MAPVSIVAASVCILAGDLVAHTESHIFDISVWSAGHSAVCSDSVLFRTADSAARKYAVVPVIHPGIKFGGEHRPVLHIENVNNTVHGSRAGNPVSVRIVRDRPPSCQDLPAGIL